MCHRESLPLIVTVCHIALAAVSVLCAAERPHAVGGIDEQLARLDSVEPPPLSVGFTPQTINVPEGFTVELAAGPPLVEHPTFATFDDRGRLFVSENAGVNMTAEELEKNLPNSIRLLEDTDNDGRFDKSTVFADKLTFPMGGAWHEGALYVASPPSIWRLEDTTGDGVADRRDVLVDKFGFTGNAASIHGCVSGPDGRLYWCDGFHGHEFRDQTGQITSKRAGSYIFSCLPDGSDVRIHCGGGMDNPVEVDFTDEGEMLGTVNILYTRPRVDALVHWLYGGAYPHREKILDEIKVTGDLLGPVHDFGHVAVSGMQRYRSGAFDDRWRDNYFVTFFNSGKVVRMEMQRDRASFLATQREFLSCDSRDFHPTDVAEDADGSLLVVDTGGWFYRGCPTSQFAKPDVLGAIYRIRRTGITEPDDPRGIQIDWTNQSNSELAALLGDPRFAVRERAIGECGRRGEAILPTLQTTLQQGDIRARMGSVWALTRMIGSSGSSAEQPATLQRATLRQALDDDHPSVRQAACRSLATYPDPAAVDQLIERVGHDLPAIRREAATSLGRIADAKAVPALLRACSRQIDRTEEHAIVYALIEINNPMATRVGLTATHSNTQRGALIALDQMDAGDLTANDVVPLVAAEDAQLQRAAANIFSRHTDWASRRADVIAQLLQRPESIALNAEVIRKLTTKALADDSVAMLVGHLLADSSTQPETRNLLLSAIADGQALPLHKTWIRPLQRLLNSGDAQTIERTIDALAAIATDRFNDALKQLGADNTQPVLLRVAALQTVSSRRDRLADESLDLLIQLLDGAPSESLQAAQKIGSASLDTSQLIRLASQLPRAATSQLQELMRPFERSKDTQVAAAFLDAMKDARGLNSLTPPQFSDVIKRYPPELLPQANELLEQLRQQEQQKLAKLDTLLPLLAHGDATRGRELFYGEKSKCSSCHRVADQGGNIGPDLTTIGANRAARDLLESVVFPSATIVRDYETVSLRTADGRVLSGLIARETVDTLFIQQQTGDPIAVARDDIEELAPSAASIMPSGLEEALSESELADVIAYLRSLKIAASDDAALGR